MAMADVSLETMDGCEVMLVGSANMDLVVRTQRFPAPGESLPGLSFQTFTGGKGANQAVAAGKLGANARLVAKLGRDAFGDALISSLLENGVSTKSILRHPTASTGVALITLDAAGQNTIVVAQGTNALLTPEDVDSELAACEFQVLLVQLEIPIESVVAASRFGDGKVFVLNPAPASDIPDDVIKRVDFLTPNETEARALTGIYPTDSASCMAAARLLLERGVKNVLFTLGSRGSFLANGSGGAHFPSISVNPVDTTGAGDAFNGAFAHFLASGETVDRAIRLANIAGALSTTRPGAQASMPTLDEIHVQDKLHSNE